MITNTKKFIKYNNKHLFIIFYNIFYRLFKKVLILVFYVSIYKKLATYVILASLKGFS